MNTNNAIRLEELVEQREPDDAVSEEPELRRSVEQEKQGKVDTNHPDAGRTGLTLAAEEKLAAREWEIERTHERWDSRQESSREGRSRQLAKAGSVERRQEFEHRRAGVDQWADPDRKDPRAELTQAELSTVNEQAARLTEEHGGMTRAAISRQLAERIADGMDVLDAVVEVIELIRDEAGVIVPIDQIENVDRSEVTVEGRVTQLWTPSSRAIRQVGLIEDESGRTKFTSWKKSAQPMVEEGERVRFRAAAKNWYQGRCSIALTGWSEVHFPERGQWWR
ncbi:DNA-binding protein [Halomicrobium zhouii]|uniref:DNA-binding protein n=1 Tax=Halomicrobium zhouii TaxID=767519 RepID=UPI000B7C59E9|nr:DNA-binding protein [Halomicrobium zhouii]